MIPQRAEILPRNISPTDQKPLRNSIFLHADQMGNPLLGIKDPSKMPAQVSGDMRDPWAYMTHLTATRYAYETLLSSPFSRSREGYGSFDFSILSSARRKNATRETTSSLKAWLHEHRKNPYPTKGEKIMLAILTKMTLTQISTWFANARRRLKKDNKMTWSPRNKTGEKKDCSSKSSKLEDDENLNSTSSNEDEEMAEYVDKNKESSALDGKELENMEDVVIENDAFSDESSLNELSQDGETETGLNSLDRRYEEAKAVWSQLSEKSPKELMKKYNSNISPVGDLQRWVDGHFGNQSPLDFPRELTPPRTPVEEIVFNGDLDSKEPVRKSSPSLQNVDAKNPAKICLSSNKAIVELHPEVTTPRLMPPRLTSPPLTSPRVTSVSEDLIRSVASNDNSLHRQFRTSGLTSHREIDAVLALTALSSR